jgi:hypothetical protein
MSPRLQSGILMSPKRRDGERLREERTMKSAIRMTVAAVIVAFIGTCSGLGVNGPSAALAASGDTGIRITFACHEGSVQTLTNSMYNGRLQLTVTVKNIGTTSQIGEMLYAITQSQKSGFISIKNVLLKPGRTLTVTLSIVVEKTVPATLVIAIYPGGFDSGSSPTGLAHKSLPAPVDIVSCADANSL